MPHFGQISTYCEYSGQFQIQPLCGTVEKVVPRDNKFGYQNKGFKSKK